MRPTAIKQIDAVLSAVVAFVLLYSGILHAIQPYYFIYSAAAYRLVPQSLVGTTMLILPYLQIVLAGCLIARVATHAALITALLLFGVFVFAQSVILVRGENLSCGCFGYSTAAISYTSLAIPIACGGLCIVLLRDCLNLGRPFRAQR